jgi:hypothetical protein
MSEGKKDHPLKNGLVRYCGRTGAEKSSVAQELSAADIDLKPNARQGNES